MALDALTEIVIVNGALRVANTSTSKTEQHIGDILVKVGLILQCLMFVFFLVLGINFQRKARKIGVMTKKLSTVLTVLYISCIIITARCIYRMIEYFQGYGGYVFRHEWVFYIFEASIMFINTAMLNTFHPARYLPRSNKVFLCQDGNTEVEGPGWDSKRPFIATLFDPFDIVGLVSRQDKKNRFWELPPAELQRVVAEQRRKDAESKAKLLRFVPFWPKPKPSENVTQKV
jgi:hypothetical protein